ncbi:MAG: cytochrome d ubiquinol oxidase subunit II [Gammaproteobacteria bacterium RIFCSPLOWO2_02_FULL_42_14]|nr:MAG: cytochrome d ubiquinol oxidase subunit II [Gammaproteobacteria bacterium RIFCSPHIGHO2_02_FULL_42_43]OGT51218.1 MAG: cytochrome d ubiquinol oxidase subunit II [Gammaproteobacteria bacterium RIFCSPHIGHO2_12_FULL_41_25]OGT62979.1 MAG: cytochrome d ubiquinol oxidase subunit II [Gammaproteobacteria bacterium RIFCSPLOWO2_02_FULL_42_14]OGT86112.1 MAG: cytochrome d ubiquinol oxidase subunit II [Gammaproteobacteria bacterium RIFCSPLOWO2_12_FULL_42_18]
MFQYEFLQIAWWFIIGCVLIVYAATVGFDVGVTMYMPFLKSETDRRVVLNTSAPTWDGNLTWIVFAGGAIFVTWPVVYSTAFSGMYAALLVILFSLFLRPPGYEYRNKINSARWRRLCDWALFISGVVPVFVFGVALGNCFLGFPFYFDPHTFRSYFPGNFFDLLSPYALLSGSVSVLMVLMHGSVYLQRRVEGHLRELAFKIHCFTAILLLMTFTISGLLLLYKIPGYQLISSAADPTQYPLQNVVHQSVGAWIQSYDQYPWKYLAPFLAYAGILESLWAAYYGWYSTAFWASCFSIGGIVGTAGGTLFPFIMPSSTHPNQSLTVWNSTSNQYALNIMLYLGSLLLIIIVAYKIFAYSTIWGKKPTLSPQDVEDNEHNFY